MSQQVSRIAIVGGLLALSCFGAMGTNTTSPATIPATSQHSVSAPKKTDDVDANGYPEANKLQPDTQPDSDDDPDTMSAAWIASCAVVIAASLTAIANIWYFRRQLRQQGNEQKIKRLQGLLDKFYGPFITLKRANKNLHDILKAQLQEDGTSQEETWRTLDRLLQGHTFEGNDKALIELILEINEELDQLIARSCGLIESPELQEKVQAFRTHSRLIRYAYEGRISGEPERFHAFVYPTGLDELLEGEVSRLRHDLEQLRSATRSKKNPHSLPNSPENDVCPR